MATKKAGTTPAKKSAAIGSQAPETETAKAAAKKATTKKAAAVKEPAKQTAAPASAEKLPGKKKPPTHAEIAALAHRLWEERGRPHGGHNDDWLRAERELLKG